MTTHILNERHHCQVGLVSAIIKKKEKKIKANEDQSATD